MVSPPTLAIGCIILNGWTVTNRYHRYGESGGHLSDAVKPLGEVVDDIAFIHNLVGKTRIHRPLICRLLDFNVQASRYGILISYALGSINDNLPTFVVLPDHRGYASNGPKNWGSAFLPPAVRARRSFLNEKID